MLTFPRAQLVAVQAVLLPAALVGCDWVSLATNAVTYRTTGRGEAANVVAVDSLAYATLAEDGVAVVHGASGATLAKLAPARPSLTADDVAVADGLLFVLDAREPGHLSVYSLEEPLRPRLVSAPRRVPVGPFSGVSAADGWVVVSGGTSELTAWRYDTRGGLEGPASADLGRGQPDVMVTRHGRAFVSTHYWGPYFGLDLVQLTAGRTELKSAARIELAGAGFTAGGAKPASFPIVAAPLGDTVLVAHARGVDVVSAAPGARPALVGHLEVGGPAVSIATRGRKAAVAVAGGAPAIVVLDFSGASPRETRRITLAAGTVPAGVALTSTGVVLAAGGRSVMVFAQ